MAFAAFAPSSMLSCSLACQPADPQTDVVKLDPAAISAGLQQKSAAEQEEEAKRREEEERLLAEQQRQRDEEEEEQRRLQEEAAEAERRAQREAEEQARLARQREEAEARRRLEEEEAARLQRELEEEQARLEREAARRAEAARLETERKRKAGVAAFLKEHGFAGGVGGPKRSIVNTTYPLHRAAKIGNAQMVEWLLQEGADALQTNSSGKTAAQVAQKHEAKGSHIAVLRVLAASPGHGSAARAAGA